jgi:hypothetical protein
MKVSKKNILMTLFVLAISSFSVMAMYGEKLVNDVFLVWVSHTEYWANGGELAQAIVRIADYKGSPITANDCNVTIYYPNKSAFLSDQPMAQSSIAGNWYYNYSLTGQPMGVYEEFVNCSYGSPDKFISTSESFHVNPALNLTFAMNQTLGDIKLNVTAIRNDTAWIIANMPNITDLVNGTAFDDWKNNATNQFNDVKTNLTITINSLCNTTESNSSDMCQLLWNMTAFQQAQNITFTNYFENITTTTTNIWDYMTTTLYNKLNDTYNIVFSINQTVTDIQTNVTAIRQDQIDEVHINIIS